SRVFFHQPRWHDLPTFCRYLFARHTRHSAPELPISMPPSNFLAGPQRVHLTLGVMNLTPESLPTVLDLLDRLPMLLPLTTAPPTMTLDALERESRHRAHALCQINQIFRDEAFITDTRPLKLHMTLMSSTYRRSRTKRPQPFDYDATLQQAGVSQCFGVQESEYAEIPLAVTMGTYEAPSSPLQDGKLGHGRRVCQLWQRTIIDNI
ncbi:hypothetical protein EDD85DRAFT_975262, partial [Armillaria nabsnona]